MKKCCALLFSVLFLSSCAKEITTHSNLNEPIVINATQQLSFKEFSLTFVSVQNESRCPINANCIWAGNAAAALSYHTNTKTVNFVLNTNITFKKDTVIDSYRIKLLELTPFPETNSQIKQADYKAKIVVTKE